MNKKFVVSLALLLVCAALVLSACASVPEGIQAGEAGKNLEILSPTDVGLPTPDPVLQPSTIPTNPVTISDKNGKGTGLPMFVWNEKERRYEIRLIDPVTGQARDDFAPIVIPTNSYSHDTYNLVRSDDGQKIGLALSDGQICMPLASGSTCYPAGNHIILVDLKAGQSREVTLPEKGYVYPLAYTSDGSRLALISKGRYGAALLLLDGTVGSILAQRTLEFEPSFLAFTKDGQNLVLFGNPKVKVPGVDRPGPSQIMLVDGKNLDVLWEQALEEVLNGYWCVENCDSSHEMRLSDNWTPAVLLSPKQDLLYIVHPDEDVISIADLNRRRVFRLEIHKPVSWFERLLALTAGIAQAKGGFEGATKNAVFSPGGAKLYILGYKMTATADDQAGWISEERQLDLQVIDPETGELLAEVASTSRAENFAISPDGSNLLIYGLRSNRPGWRTEVLDAETLERKAQLSDWKIQPVQDITGKGFLVGYQSNEGADSFAILDPESYQVVHSWKESARSAWLANP